MGGVLHAHVSQGPPNGVGWDETKRSGRGSFVVCDSQVSDVDCALDGDVCQQVGWIRR